MAISESQLETWSHQGAIQGSSTTYNSIKSVLESSKAKYAGKQYNVFLQGSYGNDTNIYAESDVDIVIRLEDCFQSDLTDLSPAEVAAWTQAHGDATYTHVDFKRDVLDTLTDSFGNDVKSGNKAIMIEANGSRRKADVIPAIQFRRYHKFKSLSDESYDLGICFYDTAGKRIANYPKQHSANLTKKHLASNQWLKPMIRVLKNVRSKLVEDKMLKAGVAPSYYLEGLLYNIPPEKFTTSYEDCFVNSINWIPQDADKSKLVCANEQYYLLWENSSTSWPKADCEAFLEATINFWKNW